MSLRDRIFAADDIGRESLEVPQWGVTLEIRTMTAHRRSQMLKAAALDEGGVDLDVLYPMLVVSCVFDPETGEAVFTNDDMAGLQEKSAAAIELVATKAMEMSGMTAKAVDAEGKSS